MHGLLRLEHKVEVGGPKLRGTADIKKQLIPSSTTVFLSWRFLGKTRFGTKHSPTWGNTLVLIITPATGPKARPQEFVKSHGFLRSGSDAIG